MKLLLHDYGGHDFTVQLARQLAVLGHEVSYYSFSGFDTPKGKVSRNSDDLKNFKITQICIPGEFQKDNLAKRYFQQLEYAKILKRHVLREQPDILMSSNSPIEVQEVLLSACHSIGTKFVFWVQDIHAEAIERVLAKKNKQIGALAGWVYRNKETSVLKKSDAVIVISPAFCEVFSSSRWKMDISKMNMIENWANIETIPLLRRDNEWSRVHMNERARIVYSGTLARKHNPDLLLNLARGLQADIYLFSQGPSADYVREKARTDGLKNVFVRPWVAVEDLPSMLAGADVLLAVIEADAGMFSVPSKVLSYMAAGRAILASIPPENLSAQNILREDAGLISAPNDMARLIADAKTLLQNDDLRGQMGKNGRAYAQATFDISKIAKKFENIFIQAH